MSPLGKFTLALLGLRFFGAEGFFVGMFAGHMLIDRTLLIKKLESLLNIVDDNIRLMLPYRYYRYYNRLDGNFWGKLWGTLLGAVLWGVNGFILLFIIGHFTFDTPNSRHARKWRKKFDHLWDNNWGKIGGAIIGFICKSELLIFSGIILGFFVDYYRMDRAQLLPFRVPACFWAKINPLKLWRHSKDARQVAFLQSMAGLAAKVAKADGKVSENEIKMFKKLFVVKEEETSRVARVFNEAKNSAKGFEKYARQLREITKNNLDLKENIIDNLFRIAQADGQVTCEALAIMHQVRGIIELPEGNFEVIYDLYKPRVVHDTQQSWYDILGVFCNASECEIKQRWKTLIVQYHPDRLQAQGATAEEIARATEKMAEINNAYQMLTKNRR